MEVQMLHTAEWLQQPQIASLSSEANTPTLQMTYLCVLVWAGEGVWSQWQVLRWEVSLEGRQWEREEISKAGSVRSEIMSAGLAVQ